jgi:hypothetical protein
MGSVLTILIPLGVVFVLLALVVRYLLRSWLDYRVRIAVIETMDRPGNLISESENAGSAVSLNEASAGIGRIDYMITGIALAVIGAGCVLIGWNMRVGQLAVGVYLGGILCVCLGFLLALVGFLVRRMRRPLLPKT